MSCSSSFTEKDLIGTWRVTNMTTQLKEISPAIIKEAEKEAKSSVYSLMENKELTMSSNFIKNGAKGEWDFNEKEKILILEFEDNLYKSKEKYNILSVKGNQMVLLQEVQGQGSIQLTLFKEI